MEELGGFASVEQWFDEVGLIHVSADPYVKSERRICRFV
jgi:hypothetical protein